MPRTVLDDSQLHPAIQEQVLNGHADIVHNVRAAASSNAVLVVGMAGNPWCRKARKALTSAGIAHQYLEYGSYFGGWKERLTLKMWTGWPTFPMVFVRSQLVGGAQDAERLIASGEMARLLAQ